MTAVGVVQVGVVMVLGAGLAAKLLAQVHRGIRPVVVGKSGDGILARIEPVAVVLLFLWFCAIALDGSGLAPQLFRPRLFQSPPAELAGAVMALAALALQLAALAHMGRSWRIGIDPGSGERLVTSGVFSISRNPIYLAVDLIAVAAFLMSGAVFFLASGLLVLTSLHVQILREERFLASEIGSEYERYRSRVGRYLGRRRNA